VAVVVAFFICWAPFHTQRLISIYSSPDDVEQRAAASKALQAVLFYSSGILYYVSSVINPILYNIMSLKFRRAFKTTLCRCGCGRCSDCCRCCRGRDAVDGRVGATGGRAAPRPRRRPMAYRFNGHGHVQMLRIDGGGVDGAHLRCPPGRRGASPASAPARFSSGAVSSSGHGRSSAARLVGHGSAANVDDRHTATNLGGELARRGGGQPRAVSCPRAVWRCSPSAEDHRGRLTCRRTRVDGAQAHCVPPASVADRTSV